VLIFCVVCGCVDIVCGVGCVDIVCGVC